jgi:hypothetical protein
MSREEIRVALDATPRRFKRTAEAANETDAFENEGVYVDYGEDDRCEAIEMTLPAVPTLHGRPLVGTSFAELREWFRLLDPDTQVDAAGLVSLSLGIGLYAPSAEKAPKEPVEAVIVFRRGYYG